MESYSVNIVGLSNKIHHFQYEISDEFFDRYGKDVLSGGSFSVHVALDKHETFIEATFDITGTAKLICDRSLDPFDYPVAVHKMMVFKFGEEDQEITDEITIIHRDTVSLKLGQLIYEFVSLAIPMKKLHPRFNQENEEDENDGIIYSSATTEDKETEQETDPRWEKLKKLK